MKKIITASQMQQVDRHTILHQQITSVDLMEKAATAFVGIFCELVPDRNTPILVCCGTGNNGGDGLAIARLLQERCYDGIHVLVAAFAENRSTDFTANLERLNRTPVPVTIVHRMDECPPVAAKVVIDALFGSGLNKPLAGDWLALVTRINEAKKRVVSVDVPSGLRSDGGILPDEMAIKADEVISFQRPKLSFFFPESGAYVRSFHVAPIGLDEGFLESLESDFYITEPQDMREIYRQRRAFTHKGTYGHALVIAGAEHTMGAAVLCAGACLYTGAGMTTSCIPQSGYGAMNARLSEVMTVGHEEALKKWERWTAVGIGPGLGDAEIMEVVLQNEPEGKKPLVLDADALNALGRQKDLLERLPGETILSPHVKEFDRLFGEHTSWWDRVHTARNEAVSRNLVIILKNQYTFIALPDGRICINTTGNPAMASGGMGDVLTGMILSLRAQGYPAGEAAMLGCYLHGRAGDLLANKGMAVVPASAIIEKIPYVLGELKNG